MAVQMLTLGGKRFVIMPESEYRKLRPKAGSAKRTSNGRVSKMSKQDIGDLAEHRRRLSEPGGISLDEVRRRIGV